MRLKYFRSQRIHVCLGTQFVTAGWKVIFEQKVKKPQEGKKARNQKTKQPFSCESMVASASAHNAKIAFDYYNATADVGLVNTVS